MKKKIEVDEESVEKEIKDACEKYGIERDEFLKIRWWRRRNQIRFENA